jgi:hypothetical protein
MHAVAEVDIPDPCRAEHDGVAWRHPAGGVAGAVVGPEIGLGFDHGVPRDTSIHVPNNQERTEKFPGHPVGRAFKKAAWKCLR